MLKYCRVALVAFLVLPLFINCSKSTKNPTCDDDTETPVDFTPKENEEAELVALCLSGELVAPNNLYNQILSDLEVIRATFGDTFEATNQIKFFPPWVPGNLMIGLDGTAFQLIRDGEYHAWDSLNQEYQATDMDTIPFNSGGVVLLIFQGRLHPWRLVELYEDLPGVWAISPNGVIGDWSNVYARQAWDEITYLFRHGWGDCPSGCIHSQFWYFTFEEFQPFFVGHWAPHEDPNVPEWWEEARLNREHYCD